MSTSSCCASESCWFESVCEAVGSLFTLLNELCVPRNCVFSSGRRSPSRYWNAAARWSHDFPYAATILLDT